VEGEAEVMDAGEALPVVRTRRRAQRLGRRPAGE
jgi:hypothetical protein